MNQDDSFFFKNQKRSEPKKGSYLNYYLNPLSIEAGPSHLSTPLLSSSSINDPDRSFLQMQEYKRGLINNPRKRSKFLNWNKEKWFLMIKLAIYLFKFLLNLMGILISIIDDYYYSSSFNDSNDSLPILRFLLTFAYSFEYFSEIRIILQEGFYRRFFAINNIFDGLSISILIFSSMFFLTGQMKNDIYAITKNIEYIVFCARILKLQGFLKFFFYYFKNEENHSSRVIEINEIKLEFIDSVLFFISYLFISASIILSMDHIFDFQLFAPFTPENRLSWHNALYYQLVTMTGIGYGDISPKTFQSRLVSEILIFYLTIHFTYFVTILISLMIRNKSVNKYLPFQKGWKNHIIIIGNLLSSESLTENFLRNHYSLLYKSQTKKFQSRMVFIYHKEPLQPLNHYLSYELINEHYTLKKIRFIQNTLKDQSWMKDANLPEAKYLVCFFVTNRKGMSIEEYEQVEKGILSSVSFAKSFYPKLEIFISLDSEPLLKEMKVYQGNNFHNSLSFYQLKRKLLALEIENQGVTALISSIVSGIHSIDREDIFYLLKKNVPDEKIKLFLINYIEGTFSRVVVMDVPEILLGLEFKVLVLLIHFLDFCEISSENRMKYGENFNYRAFLIGVKSNHTSEILLNPLQYWLSSKDRLYLIVNQDRVIDRIKLISKENMVNFAKFKETFLEEKILIEAMKLIESDISENIFNYNEKFTKSKNLRFFEEKH